MDQECKKSLIHNSKGATMIEYTFLASLILVVCVSAVTIIGQKTQVSYSQVASYMAN